MKFCCSNAGDAIISGIRTAFLQFLKLFAYCDSPSFFSAALRPAKASQPGGRAGKPAVRASHAAGKARGRANHVARQATRPGKPSRAKPSLHSLNLTVYSILTHLVSGAKLNELKDANLYELQMAVTEMEAVKAGNCTKTQAELAQQASSYVLERMDKRITIKEIADQMHVSQT